MREIHTDYTKKALREKLFEEMGVKIPDITFWTWVKKGYVFPSAYIERGSRLMPVFYSTDLPKIIEKLKKLDKQGLIRLKNYDPEETK
jgi:hypothetical protein